MQVGSELKQIFETKVKPLLRRESAEQFELEVHSPKGEECSHFILQRLLAFCSHCFSCCEIRLLSNKIKLLTTVVFIFGRLLIPCQALCSIVCDSGDSGRASPETSLGKVVEDSGPEDERDSCQSDSGSDFPVAARRRSGPRMRRAKNYPTGLWTFTYTW